MKLFSILTTLVLFALLTHTTFAQGVDPVRFTITPKAPGPNEQVTIGIEGVGTFLGNSTITWQNNGETALEGIGEHRYIFTTGSLGVPSRIGVTINSTQYGIISRNFTLVPSAVNLLWEATTSVPPLYQGKALYSAGSRVKIIAFPTIVANGTTISPNNLSFQWQRNGEPVPSASGLGRDTFEFAGDQLRTNERVVVEVYLSGVLVGQTQIVIPASDPQLVLYPRDPLRGVLYNNALGNGISLSSPEITIVAQPYFFSRESIGSSAVYSWKLNGQETTGPDTGRGLLTLRQSGSGAGEATLGVSLQNTDTTKFVQAANTALRIVFGQQNSAESSLFGL